MQITRFVDQLTHPARNLVVTQEFNIPRPHSSGSSQVRNQQALSLHCAHCTSSIPYFELLPPSEILDWDKPENSYMCLNNNTRLNGPHHPRACRDGIFSTTNSNSTPSPESGFSKDFTVLLISFQKILWSRIL